MSKENFKLEANEFRMLDHIFDIYGNALRKSDFDHRGCGRLYQELKEKGYIKEEGNEPDPKVTKTEKHYKPE
jgi:hypothetical protein